jgi:hypothetical protein
LPYIDLESFKGALEDAARPNRFMVTFSGEAPNTVKLVEDDVSYFVKSAPLPGRVIGQLELWWFGRKTNIGGDLQFEDMELRFINDYYFTVRMAIEQWMDLVASNGDDANMGTYDNERGYHLDYKGEVRVDQLGRAGEIIRTYVLEGAYPKRITNIELSSEMTNVVEEYSVTFAVDGWRIE